MKNSFLVMASLSAALSGAGLEAASVGSPAPALEPSEWLNFQGGSVTWASLKGKLILIEKWATW